VVCGGGGGGVAQMDGWMGWMDGGWRNMGEGKGKKGKSIGVGYLGILVFGDVDVMIDHQQPRW